MHAYRPKGKCVSRIAEKNELLALTLCFTAENEMQARTRERGREGERVGERERERDAARVVFAFICSECIGRYQRLAASERLLPIRSTKGRIFCAVIAVRSREMERCMVHNNTCALFNVAKCGALRKFFVRRVCAVRFIHPASIKKPARSSRVVFFVCRFCRCTHTHTHTARHTFNAFIRKLFTKSN